MAPTIQNSPDNFSFDHAGDTTNLNRDNSWIIRINYSASSWEFISRRSRIVFGSDTKIRFYNQNGKRRFNVETNKADRDQILINKTNTAPNSSSFPLGVELPFYTYRYFTESDGHTDDHKVILSIANPDNGNYPDNPLAYQTLVGDDQLTLGTITEDGYQYTVRTDGAGVGFGGRGRLTFVWRRISTSDFRIDPSLSNIIDVFVLNQNYDTKYREWIADSRQPASQPAPPTEVALETQFASIESKKAISDSIVYRAAEYKVLFGELADVELQGRFKIVKVSGTTLTNNEIKSKVLVAINTFFEIDNWDFGETFYFTELAAFVHQQLPGIISSIIITPIESNSVFGDLFQITPESNELFIPDVTLQDIDIVDSLNAL
jgi:hypothetical protein